MIFLGKIHADFQFWWKDLTCVLHSESSSCGGKCGDFLISHFDGAASMEIHKFTNYTDEMKKKCCTCVSPSIFWWHNQDDYVEPNWSGHNKVMETKSSANRQLASNTRRMLKKTMEDDKDFFILTGRGSAYFSARGKNYKQLQKLSFLYHNTHREDE